MTAALTVDEMLERIELLPPTQRIEALRLLDAEVLDITPHVEYQTDPIGWAIDKLGISERTLRWSANEGYGNHQWDGDIDPLVLVAEALRDWKDAGAESATGTGKSFFSAVLVLWFLACWEDAIVFTFAPKEDQLKLFIWKEIGKLWPRFQGHFPTAELTSLCIRMRGGIDESWGANGYPVGVSAGETVSSKAAGMHAEHMLLVYEETQGQPMAVLAAGENTCTAPHNIRLYIGNPNSQTDTLHKACTSPGVVHVRMSALDHPNVVTNRQVVPGACSRESNERRRIKYGETSPVYQSRVRGISPEQASDALIRLSWLQEAAKRWEAAFTEDELNVTGKGVDVANSEHGDRACIVDFAGRRVTRIEAFQCPDSNALGRRVKMEMDASSLDQFRVGIDAIGVGAGTVNELRRLGKVVQALNASSNPVTMTEKAPDGKVIEWSPDVNQFKNLRSQMYWQLREDLRTGNIDIPKDEELWEELIEPTFVDEPKTIIEPKADIKERLGRSPDKADALVMANWVRERAVVAVKEPPHKVANRAHQLVIKDGKLIKPEPSPKTVEELVQWAERRSTRKGARVPQFTQRVPRR